ncbi:MAG: cell division protein SepF [Clostridium sp.]|nr:cell division protein SepF [Clostridium sp.]
MGKGIDKFMNILSLNGSDDDDDYDNDDLFDDEIDLVEPPKPKKEKVKKEKPTASKPQNSSYASAAATASDDVDYDTGSSFAKRSRSSRPASRSTSGSSNKVVSMNSRGSEVYVIKPQEFNEAQTVTDFLKDGKTIVINMEGIELTAAQRIIDFIGGACYALDGTLQAISSNIFIAAPQDIEVSGDLRDEILNESTVSPYLGSF